MWRTVIVNQGEKLTLRSNNLIIYSDGAEYHIPAEDIYALVIDNRSTMISVAVLTELTKYGAHIYYCDEKHVPVSVSLPLNNHYRPLNMIKKQIEMTDDFKNKIWSRIVRQKILNQYKCLKYVGVEKAKSEPLLKISEAVTPGDKSNREAVAAKKYFQLLFGSTFRRSDDDVTNASLNYGYSIMRSSVCKTLTVYGFNCVLGLHHINENDPFNLAEDIMEPLRPVVDLWTDNNCDELFDTLTKENRKGLINLVNVPVFINGRKTRIRYAIDVYVKSLVSAINENNPDLLSLPELIPIDTIFEDDD